MTEEEIKKEIELNEQKLVQEVFDLKVENLSMNETIRDDSVKISAQNLAK